MWINKNEFEHLQEIIQNQAKTIDMYSQKLIEKQNRTVPFFDYYAERLQYWKTQFNKKPDCHAVVVYRKSKPDITIYTYDTFEEAELSFKEAVDDFRGLVNVNIKNHCVIDRFDIKEIDIKKAAHPNPYTPVEIECWARGQVEKEMQGWKVVKENEEEKNTQKKCGNVDKLL